MSTLGHLAMNEQIWRGEVLAVSETAAPPLDGAAELCADHAS